ncbi:uncharacterized protein LOC135940908 [Cloeon dipterum]|uniref:uncharacterized protein LOC135940908 n=1 Tax=Cloeon dipterum TaxID=197152 RepID=UPI0032205F8F
MRLTVSVAFWGALLCCFIGWVTGQGYAYGPPSCPLLANCKCRFPWGRGFDLSNLTTINVTLSSVNISSGDTVIFNPCPSSQALNNSCPQNAAICKVSSDGNTTHILGFHENATISTVGANTLVQYSYTDDDNSSKSTSVKLICAYNGEATTLTEDPTVPGGLILTSKEVCSTDVPDEANEDELSSGATFLFIFFSLFAAYFFGGMAILKYIKGAQGVEMIPNHEFWTSLPSLVKDGFYFAMSGCRGSPSYDRI